MMMEFALRVWKSLRDVRGIETGEWIAILALVLAVAFIVYGAADPGGSGLGLALSGTVTKISTALTGLTP